MLLKDSCFLNIFAVFGFANNLFSDVKSNFKSMNYSLLSAFFKASLAGLAGSVSILPWKKNPFSLSVVYLVDLNPLDWLVSVVYGLLVVLAV